jgi:hypothetical protein
MMVRFFVGLFMGIVLATAMSVYAVSYHDHSIHDIYGLDSEIASAVENHNSDGFAHPFHSDHHNH